MAIFKKKTDLKKDTMINIINVRYQKRDLSHSKDCSGLKRVMAVKQQAFCVQCQTWRSRIVYCIISWEVATCCSFKTRLTSIFNVQWIGWIALHYCGPFFKMQTIVLTLLFAGKIYRIEIKLDDKQSELFKKYIIRR